MKKTQWSDFQKRTVVVNVKDEVGGVRKRNSVLGIVLLGFVLKEEAPHETEKPTLFQNDTFFKP